MRRWVCVSRNGIAPALRGGAMSLWLALLPVACDGGATDHTARDAEPAETPDDAAAAQDAQQPADAASTDAASTDAGWPPFVVRPLPDSVCALAVGAECDGNEDCASGQTCCGRFEPALVAYTSIACRSECSGSNDFELCHAGDQCAQDEAVCRTSLIIPHDFIGVCARPESEVPPLTGAAVPGEVACGASRCAVGSEKCCLRARYDFSAMEVNALEPYCAGVDELCTCNHVVMPADAGPPVDDDAGAS